MRQLKIAKQITNREGKSIENYLQDISKFQMVTAAEEVELAEKIKKGDNKALETLILGNLRFVISVAKQYQHMGMSLSDLISQGNIGLIEAAKRFDEKRGFKFISYAVWWIRQSIFKAAAEQSRMIRLPQNQIACISKVRKISEKIEQEQEREALTREIATVLEMSPEKIESTLNIVGKHLSIDAPVGEDENDIGLVDLLVNKDTPATDERLDKNFLTHEVDRTLAKLSKIEREIIRFSFGIGVPCNLTLNEIGLKLNLTSEVVKQIRERALRRLRHISTSRILKTYLG